MKNNNPYEILNRAKTYLFAKHTVFASAFSQITFEESIMVTSVAFDGQKLYYNPDYILQKHEENRLFPVAVVLHTTLHYVFMHPFILPAISAFDFTLWCLACDIITEKMLMEIEPGIYSPEITAEKNSLFQNITKEFKTFNVMSVYKYLSAHHEDDTKYLSYLFHIDDHNIWYQKIKEEKEDNKNNGQPQNRIEKSDETSQKGENSQGDSGLDENSKGNGSSQNKSLRETFKENGDNFSEDSAKQWKEIAQTIKVMSRQYGSHAGSKILDENIDFGIRKQYNYRDFLKKFTSITEEIKVNQDEFDYIYYQLGMDLYHNIPLIEPLEYKDGKNLKSFVIAIDTSGSTGAGLVKKFLESTYDMIKNSEYFGEKFMLHIIQCDSKIQDDALITCQRDFDKYIADFKTHGMGGTDFRPVFNYIETLTLKKEIKNLKGLIYFTDGYGKYPVKKPKYKTAFVFMKEEYNGSDFPSWGIKTVFDL